MMYNFRHSLFFMLLFICSCNRAYYRPEDMQKLRWLEGKWVSEEAGVIMTETWKFDINENILNGTSIIAIGKDTVYVENQTIRYIRGKRIELQSTSGILQAEQQEPLMVRKLGKTKLELVNETNTRVVRYSLRKGILQVKITEVKDGRRKTEIQKYQKK